MTRPSTDSHSPRIRIIQGKDSVAIEQHRPSVLSSLTGLPVERALTLIPNLLPVCGLAQSVAASRAVEAARGEAPDPEREHARERALRREQALSAGWRLAVDWPDLLDRPRALIWLKALRHSENHADCAGVLMSAVPGLDSVWSLDDLTRWAQEEDNHAAGIIREALEHDHPNTEAGKCLTGQDLASTARELLAQEAFNPLTPRGGAVEVGPLAMRREPLIETHACQLAATSAGRLRALVLDTRQIIGNLRADSDSRQENTQAWQECAGTGTGCATTARGPVFHRVTLDPQDQVAQWRALAPTDWHFAPGGPVTQALTGKPQNRASMLAIAGFDPCAPWSLESDGGD